MGAAEETGRMLAAKFEAIFPHLDERQRRLLMGAEARALGHGGIRMVARAAGVREATVSLGVDELDSGEAPLGRARRPGGGRKRAADVDPGLRPALLALVEPEERGDPVISVATKKKELVGEFKNAGRQWRPAGQPAAVRTHDFPGDSAGKAIPYGVYDVTADAGWVNVGTDHDTAAFAVESIRRWWKADGGSGYPAARRLLITADAGGSNGYRTRAWKAELAALAAETGLEITVCHFPPGTSKWNKVEHRLFSHITMNWRGRPLTGHEVVVQTI